MTSGPWVPEIKVDMQIYVSQKLRIADLDQLWSCFCHSFLKYSCTCLIASVLGIHLYDFLLDCDKEKVEAHTNQKISQAYKPSNWVFKPRLYTRGPDLVILFQFLDKQFIYLCSIVNAFTLIVRFYLALPNIWTPLVAGSNLSANIHFFVFLISFKLYN